MKRPEHYESDLLFFFDRRPDGLALYQALFRRLEAAFPDASVKVQKSQISFYGRHLFAAVSLPRRNRPGILVTFGLPHRLPSPRIAAAAEPYPGRWTHHVEVPGEEGIDRELLGWLEASWNFSESKRTCIHNR